MKRSPIWRASSRVGARISARGDPGDALRVLERETMQDGKREGGSLAGPGLGDAEQIAALGEEGNGLRLDRRRLEIVLGLQRKLQGLGKAETVERR